MLVSQKNIHFSFPENTLLTILISYCGLLTCVLIMIAIALDKGFPVTW